jgi:hypothetical protein
MPIQVLESNKKPSFGQRFSNAVGAGLQSGQQLMQQRNAQKMQGERNKQINQLAGMDISNLPENIQQEFFKNKFAKELQADKYRFENQKKGEELRGKQEQEEASKKITQGAFDRIAQLIPKVGKGSGVLGMFGGKQAEHTGEFSSLTGALESHLVEMVNKGTLSNTRFKYITETLLPKPTDTQDEIKGKMKGLAQILDLDPSVLGSGPISKEGKRPPLSAFNR